MELFTAFFPEVIVLQISMGGLGFRGPWPPPSRVIPKSLL